MKVMKLGDMSKQVEKAQRYLNTLGSKVKITGSYNIGTVSAVTAFQKKNGLKATGIIDSETWNLLKKLNNPILKFIRKIFKKG